MSTYQSPLTVIIKGAIAGAAGTAVMNTALQQAPELIERMGVPMPEPLAPPPHPDKPDAPTAEAAERVARGAAREALDPGTRARAGEAIHWGYGAAWGAFYGVMQSSLKLPHLLHGTILGVLVYGAAATVVPRLGLTPPPTDQPAKLNAMQIGAHLVYGWATAITYAILNFGRRG